MFTVEEVDREEALQHLEIPWNNLVRQCKNNHLFQRHEWHKIWWSFMGRGKRLRVLLVRDRDQIVGIAPLMISYGKCLRNLPARKIEVIANYEMSKDNLIIPQDGPAILDTIFRYLYASRWDILVLHTRPEGQPSVGALAQVCRKYGFEIVDMAIGESPYIPLGTRWKSFSQGLGGKFCANVRNRQRRLASVGEIRHEVFTHSDDMDSLIQRVFSVSRKGWAHRENTGICSTPVLQRYYENLANVANDQGWLYFHILSVGGKDIAFEYNLLYQEVIYNLKIGFDPEYEKASPGKLLKWFVLEDAILRKACEYDMLGDADPFKREWTQQTRKHCKWYIFNRRHLYARALFTVKTRVWQPLKRVITTMRQ